MNDFETNKGSADLPQGASIVTSREYQIPLSTLFTQVFGIAAPLLRRYKIPKETSEGANLHYDFGEASTEEVNEETVKSGLGTPVNFWMKFSSGSYFKRINGEVKKVQRNDLMLPFSSIATFSRAKRNTVTYMSGSNNAVIEEYGFEAWSIKIQGFIINNEGGKTIEEQVKILQLFENLSDSINIEGQLFEWLNIHKIAFNEIKWLPRRELNLESVLPFEIDAMSDEPLELI